jgi:hypothetical protein
MHNVEAIVNPGQILLLTNEMPLPCAYFVGYQILPTANRFFEPASIIICALKPVSLPNRYKRPRISFELSRKKRQSTPQHTPPSILHHSLHLFTRQFSFPPLRFISAVHNAASPEYLPS